MRLVKVAKALGMTGQQLRHELEEVDFGVKATDREVPDRLAQGIIRFVARKHGLNIDVDQLDLSDDDSDEPATPALPAVAQTPAATVEEASSPDSLKVLRKLTLEDVSPAAIEKEKQRLATQPRKRDAGAKPVKRTLASRPQAAASKQEQIKRKEGTVTLPIQLTVKELAEKTGVQVPQVVATLMSNGVMATINQVIDFETAAIVAGEFGLVAKKEESSASAEDLFSHNLAELLRDEPENLRPRPPVVVVMGHVDHGKTSLLDAIRETDVAGKEAGGITQHIGAYQVTYLDASEKEYHITFLDTPGHEAFTAMRARGAQITDIAVIVVAADEGVLPTTVEAINHAREANVPIIVALNKMDKPGANPDKIKGELAARELQPEEWGGTVPVVPCSAKTKLGISDLLDHIVMLAEIANLKANPMRSAVATIIESHLDPAHGPLASVIVNTGTLRVGDSFLCGATGGKVRALEDARGQRLEEVAPSGAARVSGFGSVPEVGEVMQVVRSEQEARSLADQLRKLGDAGRKRSFADLVGRLSEGKLKQLKIVLKADTQGTLQAVQDALEKLATEATSVKIIQAAVGNVTESDVMLAAASDGLVVAFHTDTSPSVRPTAEREGVEVRSYDVVYTLLEDIDGLLKGLVEPEEEETTLGHIEIRGVFLTKKNEQIVGGMVKDGNIKRLPFRILREGNVVGEGRITSLKHVDKDIKEAKVGTECGLRVESATPISEGDVLEVYLRELKKKR